MDSTELLAADCLVAELMSCQDEYSTAMSASQGTDERGDIVSWFEAAGGTVHPAVQICLSAGGDRIVRASEPVGKGDHLFVVTPPTHLTHPTRMFPSGCNRYPQSS